MAETTPKKISDLDALTTPQDTDVMPVVDNSGTPTTKKSTWANIKATLKTYFDTLYESLSNKKTTLADDSDTYYPSQKAVKTAVDAKEDAANKETSALDTSTTKYPCNNVVKTAVDAKADKGANSDITSLSGLTTALSVDQGGTGQATAQAAIDALTNVSAATNEHVLTKDTATGNAIFKAASGGANTALSNLADVAINTTLKSDTDNTDDLGASDKRWANAQIVGLSRKNLVINGCGIVNQRVSAYTLVKDEYGFGPDRWAGMATGTAVSAGTLTQTTSANCGHTGYGFKFSGVTITGTGILYLRTRIESKDAIWLKNQVASFQAKVYHDVGSAVNYTIYVKKANAADDFSSTTAIGNSGAISVTSATATTIKYEAISMGDCSNGIEIEIKIECGAITTKNFELTEMQMEMGNKVSEVESQYHKNPISPSVKTYLSGSGTYTTPSGVRWLRVRMVAGGGGGGGISNGVGYINGADGGDSQFGTIYADHGSGSSVTVGGAESIGEGGSGGSGTATLRISGESVINLTKSLEDPSGGQGGSTILGLGGAGGYGKGGNGSSAPANSGGGGGGAGGNVSWSSYSLSGGGGGEYVEIYISDPAPSYPYVVGAGGAGGDGASADGGNGGSGVIIIEEHYGY